MGRTAKFCLEFLRNLHNLPGFQEPVGKEVMGTQGGEARATRWRWPALSHTDRVLAALVVGLQRGEDRPPESFFSIALSVTFLEESVSSVV